VEPIVPLIFQRTKATCFAYGQTGKVLFIANRGMCVIVHKQSNYKNYEYLSTFCNLTEQLLSIQ